MNARDDYHPNEWDKGQMIEAMWAEIDTLRSALRYLNEWCPSTAPRQAGNRPIAGSAPSADAEPAATAGTA